MSDIPQGIQVRRAGPHGIHIRGDVESLRLLAGACLRAARGEFAAATNSRGYQIIVSDLPPYHPHTEEEP